MVTVIVIGGSISGAFSGGLALGRSQSDDTLSESAVLRQFGAGQTFSGGGLPGGQSRAPLTEIPQSAPLSVEDLSELRAALGNGGGAIGGRGGFGGLLTGTIGTVDGNVFTVTTDAGETQVNLGDDSTVQLYESGTAADLSPGDRVLVFPSGEAESGEPIDAASVIVNPPDGAGIFGGGGFGGRPRNP